MASNNNGPVIYRGKKYENMYRLAKSYEIRPDTLYNLYRKNGKKLDILDLEVIGKEDRFKYLFTESIHKLIYKVLGIVVSIHYIRQVDENTYNIALYVNRENSKQVINYLSKNFDIDKDKIKHIDNFSINYRGLSRDNLKNIIVLSKLM